MRGLWMIVFVKGKLFEEIAEGLKHAKVVIVCASDEVYVMDCTVLYVLFTMWPSFFGIAWKRIYYRFAAFYNTERFKCHSGIR